MDKSMESYVMEILAERPETSDLVRKLKLWKKLKSISFNASRIGMLLVLFFTYVIPSAIPVYIFGFAAIGLFLAFLIIRWQLIRRVEELALQNGFVMK